MSADDEKEAAECCANCGTKESDDIKLKKCTCYLVRYCGVKCQKEHRSKHKRECKQRLAELHDEMLFRQPESSHLGDCPICFLPLSLDFAESVLRECCCKEICKGCLQASAASEIEQMLKQGCSTSHILGLGGRCPFCRKLPAKSKEESDTMLMKRAATNDPVAVHQVGEMHFKKGEYDKAFEHWTRAAELGDAMAHYNLSGLYREGYGVEKNEERESHHLEKAAIVGHPKARYNLGSHEWNNGRIERAVKHFIIAANLGHDKSLQMLKECYKEGHVSKDDLTAALRAHQAAVDATKSPQREEAAKSEAESAIHRIWSQIHCQK